MLIALFLFAAPLEAAAESFDDWVVACDNRHRCEMTSLYPGGAPYPEEDSDFDASMSVTRRAGPAGGFTVDISAYHAPAGKLRFTIDGTVIAVGTVRDDSVMLTGADAAKAAAAMVNGKEAALIDAAGKAVARVSLKGASAALRYIDAKQGRAGTVTAAVAKGAKGASTVPSEPAPVQVVAIKPSGTPASVSKAMRAGMEKQFECRDWYDPKEKAPAIETFALGGGKTLALLPCGAGAYNFNSVVFIVAGGKAVPADLGGSDTVVTNAAFEKGVLSSRAKGRGVGDCGNSERYVWDGKAFQLIEAKQMDVCRGSTNWLTTYRATPVFR